MSDLILDSKQTELIRFVIQEAFIKLNYDNITNWNTNLDLNKNGIFHFAWEISSSKNENAMVCYFKVFDNSSEDTDENKSLSFYILVSEKNLELDLFSISGLINTDLSIEIMVESIDCTFRPFCIYEKMDSSFENRNMNTSKESIF